MQHRQVEMKPARNSKRRGVSRGEVSLIIAILLVGVMAGLLLSQRSTLRARKKRIKRLEGIVVALDRARLWEDDSLPHLREICADIDKRAKETGMDWIVCARKYVREAFVSDSKFKYDTGKHLKTIYEYHRDPKNNPKARFNCQPSCRVLASILHYKGIRSRLVGFLTDDFDYVASHACLEVFNPRTGRWELHDVQYDMHFIDRLTGKALSAANLVFGPMDRVVPVNGARRGWEQASTVYLNGIQLRDHYYEVLAYDHPTRKCFVLININRVDLHKRFPKNNNQTMVEFLEHVYGRPAILGLPNGKYLTLPVDAPQLQ